MGTGPGEAAVEYAGVVFLFSRRELSHPMVTTLAIAKKAMSFGYKRYGVPGALASALIAVVGYRYLRKKLIANLESGSGTESDSTQ